MEFALLLPLLLAFAGGLLDFARVYQAWITLEGATRDAAEYAATIATTRTEAEEQAQRVICGQTQGLPGFQPATTTNSSSTVSCVAPSVTLVSFSRSTTAAGATTLNPVASATVSATLPFRTMFAYPFLTLNGVWQIASSSTFSVAQGR